MTSFLDCMTKGTLSTLVRIYAGWNTAAGVRDPRELYSLASNLRSTIEFGQNQDSARPYCMSQSSCSKLLQLKHPEGFLRRIINL